MTDKSVLRIARGAMIAAAYIGLVAVVPFISFGAIQFRIAEALTILPFFWPEAIFGVTIGCLVSNILWGLGIVDIVFGTLATLIASILTYWLGRTKKIWLGAIPPVVLNSLIVGFYLYILLPQDSSSGLPKFFNSLLHNANSALIIGSVVGVFVGEIGVLVILGLPLAYALHKRGLLERD